MPVRTEKSEVDRLFDALSNPTRRAILDAVRESERTAGELAAMFDMSRPSVAEHVRALVEAGLAAERRSGRQVFYRLVPAPLQLASDWLHPYERFWRDRLRDLRSALDEMDDE